MSSHKVKLNAKQIRLLKLIYKFRFVTADLLARRLSLSRRSINKSLVVLLDRGYVDRKYDSSYNLLGKPASYYLAPKAIKLLRDEHGLNRQSLNARFYDSKRTDRFIDSSIRIFDIYLQIKDAYPDHFVILNKPELIDLAEAKDTLFIDNQLPSMYIKRIHRTDNKPSEYIIEVLSDNTAYWVHRKLIESYITQYDEEYTEATPYPCVVLVCESKSLSKKLGEFAQSKLDQELISAEELTFRVFSADEPLTLG